MRAAGYPHAQSASRLGNLRSRYAAGEHRGPCRLFCSLTPPHDGRPSWHEHASRTASILAVSASCLAYKLLWPGRAEAFVWPFQTPALAEVTSQQPSPGQPAASSTQVGAHNTTADQHAQQDQQLAVAKPEDSQPTLTAEEVQTLSRKLNISQYDLLYIVKKEPALAFISPDTLRARKQHLIKRLDIEGERLMVNVRQAPRLLLLDGPAIEERVKVLMQLLDVDKKGSTQLCSAEPRLLGLRTETLIHRLLQLETGLRLDGPKEVRSLVIAQPELLGTRAEVLKQRMRAMCSAMSLPLPALRKLVAAHPALLIARSEVLQRRLSTLEQVLQVDRPRAVAAARAAPELLLQPSTATATSMRALQLLLKVDARVAAAAAEGAPSVLLVSPVALRERVEALEQALRLPLKELRALLAKKAVLLTRNPQEVKVMVEEARDDVLKPSVKPTGATANNQPVARG